MISALVYSFLASIPSKPQFQNPTTLWNYKFLSGKIRKTLINTTKMCYFKMFTYKIKFRHNIRLNTFRAIHTRKKARFKASTRESKWSRTSRTASKASTIVVILSRDKLSTSTTARLLKGALFNRHIYTFRL